MARRILALTCGEHLAKGSQAYIEGSLQTRKWEGRDGNDRYTTEVKAREVVFLGGKGEAKPKPKPEGNKEFDYGPPPMSDDDVPF